eukprot:3474337-Pleurochrysis_carterae.AAC.1
MGEYAGCKNGERGFSSIRLLSVLSAKKASATTRRAPRQLREESLGHYRRREPRPLCAKRASAAMREESLGRYARRGPRPL